MSRPPPLAVRAIEKSNCLSASSGFANTTRDTCFRGGRYRFELFDKPATFRAQMLSVNNACGYNNLGEGFYYNQPRCFQMSLTVEV